MKFTRKWMVPSLLAVLLVIAGACAKAETPPPTETSKGEIIVGLVDGLSGALAGLATGMRDGQTDGIRYINEEQDGITGNLLKFNVMDHKMDPALIMSGWDRMKDDGAVVVMGNVTGALPVMAQSCEKKQLPMVTSTGAISQLFPIEQPSYFFAMAPPYPGLFGCLIEMIESDWASKGKSGTPKIGIDIVNLGTQKLIFTKAARLYFDKKGWEHIITYTALTAADVTTQVLQMKDFGCDYMFQVSGEQSVVVWLKEMERQNFHPVYFGSTNSGSPEIWTAVGDLCVGTTAYMLSAQWTDTDNAFISNLRELNTKWHPEVTSQSGTYIRGFASIMVVAEALNRAVQKVGYDGLNAEAMMESLLTIREYEPPGFGATFTWTPTDRQGLSSVIWYTWAEDGTLKAASDWCYFEPLPEDQRTDAWWFKD